MKRIIIFGGVARPQALELTWKWTSDELQVSHTHTHMYELMNPKSRPFGFGRA